MGKEKNKKVFTGTEREILKKMIASNRPLTAYELSKKTGRTWKTAKNNLTNLKKIKVVNSQKIKKVKYWKIDRRRVKK